MDYAFSENITEVFGIKHYEKEIPTMAIKISEYFGRKIENLVIFQKFP